MKASAVSHCHRICWKGKPTHTNMWLIYLTKCFLPVKCMEFALYQCTFPLHNLVPFKTSMVIRTSHSKHLSSQSKNKRSWNHMLPCLVSTVHNQRFDSLQFVIDFMRLFIVRTSKAILFVFSVHIIHVHTFAFQFYFYNNAFASSPHRLYISFFFHFFETQIILCVCIPYDVHFTYS